MNDMSDQEKSVLLAKAMGYKWLYADEPAEGVPNLYDPANMSLAWRVHLWMLDIENKGDLLFSEDPKPYTDWFRTLEPWFTERAQRAWLDRVLEIVEVTND